MCFPLGVNTSDFETKKPWSIYLQNHTSSPRNYKEQTGISLIVNVLHVIS